MALIGQVLAIVCLGKAFGALPSCFSVAGEYHNEPSRLIVRVLLAVRV